MPITGVGGMLRSLVSLYRLTFPLTTGRSKARQASAIPRTLSCSCPKTRGRSGLPKLRQLVNAIGRAPVHVMFRADSATAALVHSYGSIATYQGLQSVVRASA